MAAVEIFQETRPNNETYWRSIVLFGCNVASYKFALAKSLLDLAEQDKTHLTAEELAAPFSKYICEHLQQADKQGTSGSSSFLEACRQYNQGQSSHDQLISTTAKLGFNNVLDAFHIVNGVAVPDPFFVKQGASNSSGIILTDQVYRLKGNRLRDKPRPGSGGALAVGRDGLGPSGANPYSEGGARPVYRSSDDR